MVCQAKHLLKHPELLLDGGIYFIPMTNPDGVRLAQEGAGFIRNKELKKNLLQINGGPDFSLWKANINGVDLNTNFDARWGQGKRNVFFPRRRKLCRQNAKQRKGDEKSHQIYQSG